MKLLGEAGSRGAHYSRFDPEDPAARQAWIDAAVPIDGAFVKGFREVARRHGLAIVATFLERGSPKPFNSAVLIDSRGDVVLHQRKRHICFFDIPEEACAAGETSSVARLRTAAGEVTIGIMICMDREFPDVAADLVGEGVEIILVCEQLPLGRRSRSRGCAGRRRAGAGLPVRPRRGGGELSGTEG
ncbi:carbon-nitrogen family hydrolase (plasmid) [Sinorhizobium americanum CCGM7]|uniref:carbon-nitrogen hydrolase family protein n=1 Tax=Sinorhizobium americanum TaxID=194963 RepID=UPI0004D43ABC|nr:carbon-nitrogen hydrolase family protein [Sinorhizobium americanum]APG88331.1 carbon-nitrogen family hydrolase [Sinorhizobium americanum CCGM7]